MDSSTKWLIKGAAVAVIAFTGTGVVTMISFLNKSNSETKVTVDIDKVRATGNMCPSGWAYIGGGYCQQIFCFDTIGGHDSRVGGKGWKICRSTFAATMRLKGATTRSTTDERCPLEEPEVGRNNSCQNGVSEEVIYKSDPPIGNIWR